MLSKIREEVMLHIYRDVLLISFSQAPTASARGSPELCAVVSCGT